LVTNGASVLGFLACYVACDIEPPSSNSTTTSCEQGGEGESGGSGGRRSSGSGSDSDSGGCNFGSRAIILLLRLCQRWRPWEGFRVMGMNGIAIYLLSCTGVTQSVLGAVYWDKREENLGNLLWPTGVYWGPSDDDWVPQTTLKKTTHHHNWVMAWCVGAYIPFWMFVAFVMHKNKFYLKV
jgi:hypothetical protein